MLYIKKIIRTDIHGIFEFQFGPTHDFLHANTHVEPGKNSGPHYPISFIFKPTGNQFMEFNGRIIESNFYCTIAPDTRFTHELRDFLFNELGLKEGDLIVLKRPETTSLTKDMLFSENIILDCITKNDTEYPFFNKILQANSKKQSGFACVVGDNLPLVGDDAQHDKKTSLPAFPVSYQKIFYGAPGTGKSYKVSETIAGSSMVYFRTTFHPDYDYANFVGTYKPIVDNHQESSYSESDDESYITYKFVPQVFAKAYVRAWNEYIKGSKVQTCLVIEEINRGNCAQIFGDIFQLLDRDSDGYSEYCIDVDEDFALYIQMALDTNIENSEYASEICNIAGIDVKDFVPNKIALPPNFYILATMNTSDQSLFSMDSAFKRRWDWEYVKIDYYNEKIANVKISIGNEHYSWSKFLKRINQKIYSVTMSEDKQIGPFFVTSKNNVIDFETFRDKVFFYLWYEIYKDEVANQENIFTKGDGEDDIVSFSDLFTSDDSGLSLLMHIMKNNLQLETV